MNYKTYLQGQSDLHNGLSRQSINKEYILGYSEALVSELVIGDIIFYDWDFCPEETVIAKLVRRENDSIWQVENMQLLGFSGNAESILFKQEAKHQKDGNLVHVSQVTSKQKPITK